MTEPSFGAALSRLWHTASPHLLAGITEQAPAVFAKYGLSPRVICHVMAEISHECGAGHELVENGNYSPEGIVKTWPSRFHSLSEAIPYAHNAEKLFNNVYGRRMGNTRPGDGFLFRGRGGTNTTGHDGYYALAKKTALDLLSNPDLVNDPKCFLECAVVDFILCGCVPFAEKGDIRGERHALNGGLIGLAEVEQWLKRWEVALAPEHGADAVSPPVVPRAPGELRFGDTGFEVKGLQQDLADKGYAVGIDNGEFHEATRRAVAGFQLDHGLPSTGVVDQATKDALARSPGMPIGESRATATVQDLREAGSRTIAGTDRLGVLARLKTMLGLGTAGGAMAGSAGAFDIDKVQSGIDKAQQAAGMFDQVKPVLHAIFTNPFALPIGAALAAIGVLVLIEARKIGKARLDDHRSAANMGR
jgi:putative chitinase